MSRPCSVAQTLPRVIINLRQCTDLWQIDCNATPAPHSVRVAQYRAAWSNRAKGKGLTDHTWQEAQRKLLGGKYVSYTFAELILNQRVKTWKHRQFIREPYNSLYTGTVRTVSVYQCTLRVNREYLTMLITDILNYCSFYTTCSVLLLLYNK